MALVGCTECGSEVSDKARACPKCGAPVSEAPSGAQTIEETAKTYKLHQILAIITMAVSGIGVCGFSSTEAGDPSYLAAIFALTAMGGLFWYLGARAMAWWDHG